MNTMNKMSIVTALIGAFTLGTVAEAMADGGRRTNDLEKDVAVRHRRLLVKGRFELAPLFESTINADFKHIIGGGLKIEYHLSDVLSIGAIGVAATAINTALVDRISDTLDDTQNPMALREPTKDQFLQRLNAMPFHGAAYVSLTPWYGKLAAFSQAYVAFDFYFQAGAAFALLQSNCDPTVCNDETQGKPPEGMVADGNPNNDAALNSGFRPGLYLGAGIHVFLNDFIALDLTVRDYAFSDNPSGADFNADSYVGANAVLGDDDRFIHHLFFGVGLSIMFPTAVKRTN